MEDFDELLVNAGWYFFLNVFEDDFFFVRVYENNERFSFIHSFYFFGFVFFSGRRWRDLFFHFLLWLGDILDCHFLIHFDVFIVGVIGEMVQFEFAEDLFRFKNKGLFKISFQICIILHNFPKVILY